MLTAEQIKERPKTAFLPHKAIVKIDDYDSKISFRVQSKTGHPCSSARIGQWMSYEKILRVASPASGERSRIS